MHSNFILKMGDATASSSRSSSSKGHTINSFGMGRLHHKNAIVTGAAGYVFNLCPYFFLMVPRLFTDWEASFYPIQGFLNNFNS